MVGNSRIRISTVDNPDCFVIQSLTDIQRPSVIIERTENGPKGYSTRDKEETRTLLKTVRQSVDCFGILGVLRIPTGVFLAVVKDCRVYAKICGIDIYCVTEVNFIPFANRPYYYATNFNPTMEIEKMEKIQSDMKKWLETNFYFSLEYDITNRVQISSGRKKTLEELWTNMDPQFHWNRKILQYFLKNELQYWSLAIMKGFIQAVTCVINNSNVEFALISRISCLRVGARFIVRGVNDDGHVANFVETEQIMVANNKITSSVIIRGSIPLFWEQKLIRGKHRAYLSRGNEAHMKAFRSHFDQIVQRYGKVHIVNLLSNNEKEGLMLKAFEKHYQELKNPDVNYHAFDFHEMLGKSGKNFHLVSPLLLDPLQADMIKFGLYFSDVGGPPSTTQKGVFRVNCLDCLDRTNVCQGSIARRYFMISLQLLGVLSNITSYDFPEDLVLIEEIYKEVWANNGDAISLEYTGTGALKSNLTRTGKLTIGGMVGDGMKSVMRGYQNMFLDDFKQEIIDYFLGNKSSAQNSLEDADWMTRQLKARESEFIETENWVIYIGTWNVNGQTPDGSLSLWLHSNVEKFVGKEPDIYVIGFQEVVALTTTAVWNANEKNTQLWHSHILQLISKNRKFVVLRSYQLVGLVLSIFVREDQLNNFRDVSQEIVKVGVKGISSKFNAGNKGGITIRFEYHRSSFCFTCAHFCAGQNYTEERNRHYFEIFQNTKLSGHRTILDHDYVFFFGDLNYRIDFEHHIVMDFIREKKYNELFEQDQLNKILQSGFVFKGFTEGAVTFPPTYKYDPGTNIYDTSEKNRVPAWCDRILFRANDIKQYYYDSTPLLLSDHKPVSSVFSTKVKTVNKEKEERVKNELLKIQNSQIKTNLSEAVPQAMLIDFSDDSNQNTPVLSPDSLPFDPFGLHSEKTAEPDLFSSANSSYVSTDLFSSNDSVGSSTSPPLPPKSNVDPQTSVDSKTLKVPPPLPPKQRSNSNPPPVEPQASIENTNKTTSKIPPSLPPKSPVQAPPNPSTQVFPDIFFSVQTPSQTPQISLAQPQQSTNVPTLPPKPTTSPTQQPFITPPALPSKTTRPTQSQSSISSITPIAPPPIINPKLNFVPPPTNSLHSDPFANAPKKLNDEPLKPTPVSNEQTKNKKEDPFASLLYFTPANQQNKNKPTNNNNSTNNNNNNNNNNTDFNPFNLNLN